MCPFHSLDPATALWVTVCNRSPHVIGVLQLWRAQHTHTLANLQNVTAFPRDLQHCEWLPLLTWATLILCQTLNQVIPCLTTTTVVFLLPCASYLLPTCTREGYSPGVSSTNHDWQPRIECRSRLPCCFAGDVQGLTPQGGIGCIASSGTSSAACELTRGPW